MANKHKIINDPVFGFMQLESDLEYDVLQHPYVQRLGRIRQLGLSNFVLGLCKFHIILHFSSNHPRNLTHGMSKRSHTGTETVPYWESYVPILGLKS